MCDVISGGPGMCDNIWQGEGAQNWLIIAWRTLWTAPYINKYAGWLEAVTKADGSVSSSIITRRLGRKQFLSVVEYTQWHISEAVTSRTNNFCRSLLTAPHRTEFSQLLVLVTLVCWHDCIHSRRLSMSCRRKFLHKHLEFISCHGRLT